MAQVTLDLSLDLDLSVMSLSPTQGSMLGVEFTLKKKSIFSICVSGHNIINMKIISLRHCSVIFVIN